MRIVTLIYELLKTILIVISLKYGTQNLIFLVLLPSSLNVQLIIILSFLLSKRAVQNPNVLIQVKVYNLELYFVKDNNRVSYVSDHSKLRNISFEKVIASNTIFDSKTNLIKTGTNFYFIVANIIMVTFIVWILKFVFDYHFGIALIFTACMLFFYIIRKNNIVYKYYVNKRGKQKYYKDNKVLEIYKEPFKYFITPYPENRMVMRSKGDYCLFATNKYYDYVLFRAKDENIVKLVKDLIEKSVNYEV